MSWTVWSVNSTECSPSDRQQQKITYIHKYGTRGEKWSHTMEGKLVSSLGWIHMQIFTLTIINDIKLHCTVWLWSQDGIWVTFQRHLRFKWWLTVTWTTPCHPSLAALAHPQSITDVGSNLNSGLQSMTYLENTQQNYIKQPVGSPGLPQKGSGVTFFYYVLVKLLYLNQMSKQQKLVWIFRLIHTLQTNGN